MRNVFALAIVGGVLGALPVCHAEGLEEAVDPLVVREAEAARTPVGAALPLGAVAPVRRGGGFAIATAGYDGGAGRVLAQTTAEIGLHDRFALQAGVMATEASARPVAGVRVQLLREARHGIDGSATLQYKPEGFTEGEGELELLFAARRTLGRVALVGGLGYGQDPEAHERDGEVRLGAMLRVGDRAEVGLDGRLRANLAGARADEPRYDVVAGPVATLGLGPAYLVAQAGLSCTALSHTTCGPGATAGLGAAF